MNFDNELKKPLFFINGRACTLNEAQRTQTRRTGLYTFSGSSNINEAVALANDGLIKIANSKSDDIRQLIVERLQSDPKKEFRFINGKKYNGIQAAQEILQHTKEGEYFVKLEKRTIQIVLEAIREGKVK
jgi:hypothetical protein